MKKYKLLSVIIAFSAMTMMSCGDDFLTTESASRVPSGTAPDESVVWSNLVATYNILLHDDYSDGYNSVLLTSDLRSDDIFKGGESAGDQSQLYALATFTSSPSNNIDGAWNLNYYGIALANNTINNANNAISGSNMELVNRYKAEALLLRVYYYHLLWKNWGNIPYFTEPLGEPFVAPQYKADEVYGFMMEDIRAVEELAKYLPMSTNKGAEMGRLNLAFLYMLKARIVMYQKDEALYGECADDMAKIIKSGNFSLFADFDKMWEDENEFCSESLFEVNLMPDAPDWNGRNGYGTNLPAFISPSELTDPNGVFKGGWGFAPVRPYIWNSLYEEGDTRKEGTVNNWIGEKYNERFQDTGIYMRKYAARTGYNPYGTTDLAYCNNLRLFRYAEALLNYAELSLKAGEKQGIKAQDCMDQVRARAFGKDKPLAVTLDNIKLERRREFMGEGLRFWDLIRWGDAPTVLSENYTGTTPSGKVWDWSRTFTNEKKYLPIPEVEINATKGSAHPLVQNPGW